MFSLTQRGSFKNFYKFSQSMQNGDLYKSLRTIAQEGVSALASQTPRDSGVTADSWDCEIEISRSSATITWFNTNIQNGFNVAIGLQYGHGTGTGGWVSGYDYINPAIRPIFDAIANQVWREVTNA